LSSFNITKNIFKAGLNVETFLNVLHELVEIHDIFVNPFEERIELGQNLSITLTKLIIQVPKALKSKSRNKESGPL
jgi:hypothetical protein